MFETYVSSTAATDSIGSIAVSDYSGQGLYNDFVSNFAAVKKSQIIRYIVFTTILSVASLLNLSQAAFNGLVYTCRSRGLLTIKNCAHNFSANL